MRGHRGMTLVEILVLAAILGMLAAVILPALTRVAVGQEPGPVASAPDDADSTASSVIPIAISLI